MSAKLLIMSAKLIIMSAKLLSMSATPHVMLKAPCKAQCVHCAMVDLTKERLKKILGQDYLLFIHLWIGINRNFNNKSGGTIREAIKKN